MISYDIVIVYSYVITHTHTYIYIYIYVPIHIHIHACIVYALRTFIFIPLHFIKHFQDEAGAAEILGRAAQTQRRFAIWSHDSTGSGGIASGSLTTNNTNISYSHH